jgi:hypothetical protein
MTCRMSITRLRSVACLGALGALVAGCAADSGPTRTENRTVDAFHAIELRGAAQMQVDVGKGPALSITAGEEVLQSTNTEVRDGVLVVQIGERRGWFHGGAAAKLAIQAPALESMKISGAGDFTLREITGERLSIVVEGAGKLQANGTVHMLTARIDGAGSADLAGLAATDADVAVNGAGSLEVNASGALKAEVNGVGSITYSGDPQKVVSSVRGVGRISPAGAKK